MASSRIPRLVLHVGIHKTGTTTLQIALETLRKQLRAKGVALITISQMKKLPHEADWGIRRTADQKESGEFRGELLELVEREIGRVQRKSGEPVRQVLITNERMVGARMPSEGDSPRFRPAAEAAISDIIAAVDPEEVHVALYTRRQDRLMESCYLWEVQRGRSHSITDQFPFLEEPVMTFSTLAERIKGIPRITSLRVRPFEIIGGGTHAYLDDFLSNLGMRGELDFSRLGTNPMANVSYSHRALEVARLVNPLLDTPEQRTATRRYLKSMFPTGMYPPAKILADDQRERIIAAYRIDNERLFATWMPGLPVDAYSTPEGTARLGDTVVGVQ
jgi:hypothetical protein